MKNIRRAIRISRINSEFYAMKGGDKWQETRKAEMEEDLTPSSETKTKKI